jgi:Pyruvate/2-oxoacid:ferredoxin oxidoreductase delta subunit
LVRAQETIAVAPCICRREHTLMGVGCDAPEETCLVFGAPAEYYIENGFGRAIGVSEALAILQLAEHEGLVLQPSNAKRIANICCCCGCCCQVLLSFKRHPKPASIVSTPYQVQADPELCIGCEECVSRCQMGALRMVEEVVEVDLDRCIGCGLCVTTCSSESLHLARKPAEQQVDVPASLARTYMNLARVRGLLDG